MNSELITLSTNYSAFSLLDFRSRHCPELPFPRTQSPEAKSLNYVLTIVNYLLIVWVSLVLKIVYLTHARNSFKHISFV